MSFNSPLNSQRLAAALRITLYSDVGAIFCAPFADHSLGRFGGTATEGERKRTPTARGGKQTCVNDLLLEMVPFLFSVPGPYSTAGIERGTTPERSDKETERHEDTETQSHRNAKPGSQAARQPVSQPASRRPTGRGRAATTCITSALVMAVKGPQP